jgi:FdhD protein
VRHGSGDNALPRVNGSPITVTMRTPGSDIELAQGFLLTEGIIARRDDVLAVRYCRGSAGPDGANTYNVVDVTLAEGVPPPAVDITRNFYTTSSCGVCGKASIDAVRLVSSYSTADQTVTIAASTLTAMPDRLRLAQKVFSSTGGLHGAGVIRSGRHHARGAGGHRPAQRRRQGDRLGA